VSVTEIPASRPTEVDISGNGLIAWVPNDLIAGAFNRSVNADSRQRIALLARGERMKSEARIVLRTA